VWSIGDGILILLNAELNPICHLLAILGAHHILHFSRIGVNRERKGVLGEKPLPVPLVSEQTSHGLTWGRNRDSTLRT